jgi:ATP-dependent RNA helicase DHX8/PRP22
MGINDLLNFEFMDPPPVQTLINSLESLYALGALDDEGLLTKMGMKMAEFPLSPQESKMLLTAVDLGCGDEICTIISMLQVHNVFFRPKDKATVADQKRAKFNHPDGDFLTILTVYEAWKQNNFSNIWCSENYLDAKNMRRAQDVRKQLVQILERYKFRLTVCNRDYARVRKAITAGFFVNAAKRNAQEGYKTIVDDHTVYIHPSSSLFNR